MKSKLMNKESVVFLLYLVVSVIFLVSTYHNYPQANASSFDLFYTLVLVRLIAFYGLICFSTNFRLLIIQIFALGILLSVACIILFVKYVSDDFYFLFENFSHSWIDTSGIIMIILYIFAGSLTGVCIWAFKRFIFKLSMGFMNKKLND